MSFGNAMGVAQAIASAQTQAIEGGFQFEHLELQPEEMKFVNNTIGKDDDEGFELIDE